MEIKPNIKELELGELYEQLGLADFTYVETIEYAEMLEQYRIELLHEIKKRMKNGNS